MSFPAQNNRRNNNSNRPRNNNNNNNPVVQSGGARREWVARGSAPTNTVPFSAAPVTPVTTTTVVTPGFGGNGRDNENVSSAPVNRFQNQNQTYGEPKFNRGMYRGRGRGSYNHQENRMERPVREVSGRINQERVKDPNLPQLVQEIEEKLLKGNIECMICYDMVRRSAPMWSCSSCYSIFHLHCTKKWARAPTSVDTSAEKNQRFNWRCPGCQSVQLTSSRDIRYLCFCGKRQDPPSDLYLTPHSCGEPCGKKLEKELPGNGLSEEDLCPHVCVLQCHPGPCPPCKAFAPARSCPCGKEVITTRCSDRKSVLTCGQQCGKLLDCGRHRCEQTCHVGSCGHCQIVVDAYCFCKKKTESLLCGDMGVKGDIKMEDGVFSCNSVCGKKLSCGNHICRELCHPGPCGDCALLPSKVKACCCGKTSLEEERHSCLDPIPTCSKVCGKRLRCGVHRCEAVCHSGDCAPCLVPVTQRCRCGSTSRTVECYRTQAEDEQFTCDRPCGQKKNCGRHRCSERCCPLSNPKNSITGGWNPHFCSMACEKKLRCGQHSCESLCHSGHCPPCLETIFTDLTCACGRTSIPPPLPCGTPLPSCQLPCSVSQPCGHPPTHSCHFGDCLPCAVPVAKECVGGHVILRNIPCGSKDIRCNKLCGKTRQCGLHSCARTCHPSPCDVSAGPSNGSRASCGQTCGAPRRDCRHTCTALCHPSSSCPDVRCEFPVTITCSCGRITANVPCDAGGQIVDSVLEASIIHKLPSSLQPIEINGKKVPLGQRKLTCDDECAKMEKKKVLSDAFGITPPNLESLHFGENAAVSEVLGDLLRRDAKWVLSIEERCKFLVLGRSRGGLNALKVHVFCPMLKEKRDAIRLIAARWKLSVNAAGWEPKRFIAVHVTPKSKAPSRILGPKGCTVNNIAQPAVFDSLVDMDPRLVVALFDLPRDADISALVLRFGGECELVWLNDKNALAVFSDPARAATAMRRLDQGSAYCGAAVVHQSGVASAVASTTNVWGVSGGAKDAGGVAAALKGNPWKKAVVQEPHLRESLWDAEEWSKNPTDLAAPSAWRANEAPPTASSNRWSVLEPEIASSLPRASITIKEPVTETQVGGSVLPPKPQDMGIDDMADVVDDWDKAYD
ncbi:NF-X1-type zinc finger protein NFXL1 [Solanum pennellii]|uniref:NF-X1-type zinc finger protein NFXL1 n=1 Tax=Solanum pennellii TaxID=28526 RepID=A0ABM1GF42_SOLPN|nr:NF-X1-type zinc finger protein NFXL1 [Solanum pennellii]